jgi:hypothetical protein
MRFVGTLPSAAGHLGVSLEGGRIVIRTPVYGANDPNCCPSALHYGVNRAVVSPAAIWSDRLQATRGQDETPYRAHSAHRD